MLIYFDTEFTELGIDPKLISIGFISEQGDRTFYAELTDAYQPSDCSDFVREAVLPHLEGGEARMDMHELTLRLGNWLESFAQPVQLATDSSSEYLRCGSVAAKWSVNHDPFHRYRWYFAPGRFGRGGAG